MANMLADNSIEADWRKNKTSILEISDMKTDNLAQNAEFNLTKFDRAP